MVARPLGPRHRRGITTDHPNGYRLRPPAGGLYPAAVTDGQPQSGPDSRTLASSRLPARRWDAIGRQRGDAGGGRLIDRYPTSADTGESDAADHRSALDEPHLRCTRDRGRSARPHGFRRARTPGPAVRGYGRSRGNGRCYWVLCRRSDEPGFVGEDDSLHPAAQVDLASRRLMWVFTVAWLRSGLGDFVVGQARATCRSTSIPFGQRGEFGRVLPWAPVGDGCVPQSAVGQCRCEHCVTGGYGSMPAASLSGGFALSRNPAAPARRAP